MRRTAEEQPTDSAKHGFQYSAKHGFQASRPGTQLQTCHNRTNQDKHHSIGVCPIVEQTMPRHHSSLRQLAKASRAYVDRDVDVMCYELCDEKLMRYSNMHRNDSVEGFSREFKRGRRSGKARCGHAQDDPLIMTT